MRKKNIVVKSTVKRKRWTLEISGSDWEARRTIVKAVAGLDGFEIINGANPFGEAERKQKKLKPGQEPIEKETLPQTSMMGLAL